jgi:hypothetical protein
MALGDLIIKVGGNIDGFRDAMKDGSQEASRFGASVETSISKSVGLYDAFGRQIQNSIGAAVPEVQKLAAAETQVAASAELMAKAHGHAVSEIQAVSGALRVFEGHSALRAAERFVATTLGLGPALQGIFPIVGALAMIEMLGNMAKGAYDVWKSIDPWSQAIKRAADSAKELDAGLGAVLAKARELEQKEFEHSFGEVAGSFRKAADQSTVTGDQGRVAMLESQIQIARERLAAATQRIQSTTSEGGADPMAAREYDAAIKDIQTYTAELNRAQVKLDLDQKELRQEGLNALKRLQSEQEKIKADALAAAREHAAQLKQNDELALAQLKSHHELSLGQIVNFWRARLEAESTNAERSREIQITLGTLHQEQQKMLDRVSAHGAETQKRAGDKAEAEIKRLHHVMDELDGMADKNEAAFAKDVRETGIADIRSTGQGISGAAQNKKQEDERAYGLALDHSFASQIRNAQQMMADDNAIAQAHIDTLTALQDEAKVAGDQNEQRKYGLELQEAIIRKGQQEFAQRTRVMELEKQHSLAAKLSADGSRIAGGLGGGLAAGIMSGKGIGEEIKRSLTGIGQQMLGNVFTAGIEKMVTELGLNTAAQALMTEVTTGASLSTIANTVATEANTIWLAVKGFLGFADGGSPPVGVPSIVGERGPELFIPRGPGVIIPSHKLSATFAGSVGASSSISSSVNSGGNTFHIHGVRDMADFARKFPSFLKSAGGPRFSPAT